MTRILRAAALSTLILPAALNAAEADKSQYNLLNPTPRHLMRDLSTDRPDITEGPQTVDAGHFQFEVDLFNYGLDRHGSDTRTDRYTAGSFNLKAGLLNNVDLQVVIDAHVRERVKDRAAGTSETRSGFGDIQTRLKINLWGNDGGETALGLMPFIKIPTAQDGLGNNSVEGGLIVPFAAELPAGWGMGLMAEFDFLKDEDDDGYHTEFVNTITFGHDIVGNLAGYVEFVSVASTESGARWQGLVGVGFTYGLTPDLQLDGGVNFAVTRSAEDINPFAGVTWRF